MITAEIRKMTKPECICAMEELWDVLCHQDEDIESPEWHSDILEERRKKIKSGEAEFLSLKDL